jgi:hypothetical protein
VQLATTQKLARYWAKNYDWRMCEAKLNALPQFVAEIDGLDIHFIHVRPKHENALPMIVTHGWPGSIIEQLKIIDPLTNPTAHGANASDLFQQQVRQGHALCGLGTDEAVRGQDARGSSDHSGRRNDDRHAGSRAADEKP